MEHIKDDIYGIQPSEETDVDYARNESKKKVRNYQHRQAKTVRYGYYEE